MFTAGQCSDEGLGGTVAAVVKKRGTDDALCTPPKGIC